MEGFNEERTNNEEAELKEEIAKLRRENPKAEILLVQPKWSVQYKMDLQRIDSAEGDLERWRREGKMTPELEERVTTMIEFDRETAELRRKALVRDEVSKAVWSELRRMQATGDRFGEELKML